MIETPKDIQDALNSAGFKYNIPPSTLKAFAYSESRFRSEAISPTEVHGMFQITSSTWRANSSKPYSIDNKEQAEVAAKILSKLSKKYNNNIELMAIGYNAGEGIADKLIGKDITFNNVQNAIISHKGWASEGVKNVDKKVNETWDYISNIKNALEGELSSDKYEYKSTPGTRTHHIAKVNAGNHAITPDLSINTNQLFLVAANDSRNFREAIDKLYTVCVTNTSRNGLKHRTNSLFKRV